MQAETGSLSIARRIEGLAALTALVLLAVGCVWVLWPFFSALLWAFILTFATWPAYAHLERRLRHRPSLAAFLMTVLLALAFILPLVLIAVSLADTAVLIADWLRGLLERGPPPPPAWAGDVPLVGPELLGAWGELAGDAAEFAAFVQPYLANARGWALQAALAMGEAGVQLSLSVFAAFFFYRDGLRAVERIRVIGERIAGDRIHHLLLLTAATTRAVVYGTIGAAMAQGALAALGFWIAGVPAALFFGLLTFLLGLAPIGPPLLWLPVSVWLATHDEVGWAVFMALWGFLAISGIDNLVKPILISRESRMPILIVSLGVLGGALAFGLIGIFLGPTLLGVGYALLVDWSAAAELPRPRDAAQATGAWPRTASPPE